jgi:hypothetical protein
MNVMALNPPAWSRGRWWTAFSLALLVQVSLIYLLSDRRPLVARQATPSPEYYLLLDTPPNIPVTELLNLNDPTLFVLPGLRGFSGLAWLRPGPLEHPSPDSTGPECWLTQDVSELGRVFRELLRTNVVTHRSFADKPAPKLSAVNPPPIPLPIRSSLRVEGDLALRELPVAVEVPSVPHPDLLANTVIQLAVDAWGFTLFPVVLSGSGSKSADQQALDLARAIRFKPLVGLNAGAPLGQRSLTWGRLVFQWHTVPAATPSP